MPVSYDLFVSYRWADAPSVAPVLDALAARGVSVWRDAREVEDFQSIQRAVSTGLASSRAMLVWYSRRYNESRACQWELTSAYVAAQTGGGSGGGGGNGAGDPRRRILVVNPETSNAHILLPELFDQLQVSAVGVQGDAAAVERIADAVQVALKLVPETAFGELRSLVPPAWIPSMGTGSARFVGRLREMWALHGTLQAGQAAMLTGTGGKAGLALVRGAGGIGKSLMAEEYALRFGAAYPGGVFWLRAYGYADGGVEMTVQQRSQAREVQFIDFSERLGIDTRGLSAAQVSGALGRHLGHKGLPFLWVVDDLPPDPGPEGIQGWQAPHPLGCTLFTSRTRRFSHVPTLELPQLDPADARALLTRRRALSAEESATADAICSLLGFHALAVDVTAALVALRGLPRVLKDLQNPGRDALELAAQLDEALPNGHQREIAATFLASIAQLDSSAQEVLRDAAVLAAAPIPVELLAASRAAAEGIDEHIARDAVAVAVSKVRAASLADDAGQGLITVHVLVSRTLRFAQQDGQRWEERRRGMVPVLSSRMTQAKDIRVHGQLSGWVEQARALSEAPDYAQTAALRGWVALFDFVRGAFALACRGYEEELAVCRRVQGEEHPYTLTSMNNLAVTHAYQGEWVSAIQLMERAAKGRQVTLGADHSDTQSSIQSLAAIKEAAKG
jgi:hypothetical protein